MIWTFGQAAGLGLHGRCTRHQYKRCYLDLIYCLGENTSRVSSVTSEFQSCNSRSDISHSSNRLSSCPRLDMASAPTSRLHGGSPLLALPAELRISIYEHVFSSQPEVFIRRSHTYRCTFGLRVPANKSLNGVALLSVSKQIRSEARDLFWDSVHCNYHLTEDASSAAGWYKGPPTVDHLVAISNMRSLRLIFATSYIRNVGQWAECWT